MVGWYALELFTGAIGPIHLYGFDRRMISQPEVHARILGTEITGQQP